MERIGAWTRTLVAALALGLVAPAALAHNHDHDRQQAEQLLQSGQILPLQEILARVARDYPGQVLKVEFEQETDWCGDDESCPERWIYELKLLQSQGRLVKLKVDARTGEVLWVGRRPAHSGEKP